jgi:hypothetical protein
VSSRLTALIARLRAKGLSWTNVLIMLTSVLVGSATVSAFMDWATNSPLRYASTTSTADGISSAFYWIIVPMARFGADTSMLAQVIQLIFSVLISWLCLFALCGLRNFVVARRSSRITANR